MAPAGGECRSSYVSIPKPFRELTSKCFCQAFAADCVPVEKPFFDGMDQEFITEKFMKTGFLRRGSMTSLG